MDPELQDSLQMTVIPEGSDDNEKMIYDALRSSFSVKAAGEMQVEGRHAQQSLEVTYLDLKQLMPPVKAQTEKNIDEYVENHSNAEIYDEDDNYKSEIMENAYSKALRSALSDVSKYYTTVELPLQLSYENGHWQTQPDEQIKVANHRIADIEAALNTAAKMGKK